MKNKKTKWMLGIFVLICLSFGMVIVLNKQFNSQKHELEFGDNILEYGAVCDENVTVTIRPRGYESEEYGAWYHSYHLETDDASRTRHAVGTIYELSVANLSNDVISEWTATIYMPRNTMINSGWNGSFEIHQNVATDEKVHTFENSTFDISNLNLDYSYDQAVLLIPLQKDDYFVYTPNEAVNENRIDASKKSASEYEEYNKKTIGFITYTDGQKLEYVMKFTKGSIYYKMHRGLLRERGFWIVCVALLIWVFTAISMFCVSYYVKKTDKEKQVIETMVRKFETDDLTHTYTRSAFFHYADTLLKEGTKLYGFAIVDVDGYKLTANQYGEKMCNLFLQYLADYFVKITPNGYVGRYSESKYAIISELEDGVFDAEKYIDAKMIKESPMPNQVLKVGVYAPANSVLNSKRCCDRAILALTKIRGKYGQNISYYEDSFESQLIDDRKIEEYMEIALAENQFEVYYQPKHDTETKKIIGAEALVRWKHPKYGFMSPGQFIPIFERTGFISKLDAYVIEKVCHDIKQWGDEGKKIYPISVNVSRKDFYEDGWIRQRLNTIEQAGVDTKSIHMEVTESLYAEDIDLIAGKVKKIKERGIKIELDDFGSGYSSLGLLSMMSLDVLKLDISFVRHIDSTEVVVESIIGLAHKLGLSVIAEGVETQEQYDIIKKHGCDYIQGYYFASPMPKQEFEEYINN